MSDAFSSQTIWNWLVSFAASSKRQTETPALSLNDSKERDGDAAKSGGVTPSGHYKMGREQNEIWNTVTNHLFQHDSHDTSGNYVTDSSGVTLLNHIRQKQTWDCGVACLLMIADWLTATTTETIDECACATDATPLRASILEMIATESIWTVDLLFILQAWQENCQSSCSSMGSFSFMFSTLSMLANEAWRHVQYYSNSFEPDRDRVSHRLEAIRPQNVLQSSTNFPLALVAECIQNRNCVAIALIDTPRKDEARGNSEEPPVLAASYVGHFILLTGISYDSNHLKQARQLSRDAVGCENTNDNAPYCFVVYNPGYDTEHGGVCYWTVSHFERSWRTSGTDEDIIFVKRHELT